MEGVELSSVDTAGGVDPPAGLNVSVVVVTLVSDPLSLRVYTTDVWVYTSKVDSDPS